jgi:dienelactone hydrolase
MKSLFTLSCLYLIIHFPFAPLMKVSDGLMEVSDFHKDSVWITTETGTIFGILYSPADEAAEKRPAMLCLQGGGDVGLSNYLYEARFFAENGFVALVCDKAGTGLSKGSKSWRDQTFDEKTQEYFQLLQWLKKQAAVDPAKVGVHGMSEGGRLALDLAIKHPKEVAFVNAVSGPIESFKKNQLFAIRHHLKERNVESAAIDKAVSMWNQYFDDIAKGEISEEVINKANLLRGEVPYLPANSRALPQRPRGEDIHFSLESKMNQIKCPALFQFGDGDILVDVQKTTSLIPKAPHLKVVVYKNTNHSMTMENGDVHPDFLTDKLKWYDSIL